MGVKKASEKADLNVNIQNTMIVASSLITSWQRDGKQWKQLQTIFLGSKIIVDGDCSLEIKMLTSQKEIYDKPTQHIKEQRHHLPTKVHIVNTVVLPVVMYRCECQIIRRVSAEEMMLSNFHAEEDS